jgi:hypothetical protein
MAYGALIANRNKVWDSTVDHDTAGGSVILGDLDNLKTPQLGETVTIVPSVPAGGPYRVVIEIVLAEADFVGVIGLLNASRTLTAWAVSLYDAADAPIIEDEVVSFITYPSEDYIPPNFWRVFDTPHAGVKRIVLYLELLDSEGSITVEESALTLGGLWAGPAWVLDTVDAAWGMEIAENAIIVEADGSQTRTMPSRKFRILSFRLSNLSEREAYGIDDGVSDEIAQENSLLDLFMYSGKSRPIVAFPRLSTAVRQAAMGVYGYMTGALRIKAASGPQAGDEPSRHSSDQVNVRESL